MGDVPTARDAKILLRWVRILILHDHNQILRLIIFDDCRIDDTEIGIEKHLCRREFLEIFSRNVIDTVIQSLFAFARRYFFVPSGNSRGPKDVLSLCRFIVE